MDYLGMSVLCPLSTRQTPQQVRKKKAEGSDRATRNPENKDNTDRHQKEGRIKMQLHIVKDTQELIKVDRL